MVMCNESGQMLSISFVLHLFGDDKTLELFGNFPVSPDLAWEKENGHAIEEVVKHVREIYGLNDETLIIKLKSTEGDEKTNISSDNTVDVAANSELNATENNVETPQLKLAAGLSFYCKDCDLRYRHFHNFEAHMKTHQSTEKKTVGKKNSNADGSSDKRANRYCELCDKYFYRKNSLKYHIDVIHLGLKPLQCDFCEKRFNSKYYLAMHRRIHTGECPFICEVCGSAWRTTQCLFRHKRLAHTKEKPYKCQVCNATFMFKIGLNKHSFMHAEKKYICETCGKRFSAPNDFKRHLITHNGLKPFKCQLCPANFNQKHYLRNHLRAKHRMTLAEARDILKNINETETIAAISNATTNTTDE